MKKILALALVLAMMGMCGISLAQEQNYVGLWRLTSLLGIVDTVNIEGMAVDMAALGIENEYEIDPAEVGMDMIIELNEDGVGRFYNMGPILTCTWAIEEGALLIKSGAETLIGQPNGEGFSIEMPVEEGMKLRLNLTRAEGVFEDYVQVVTAAAPIAAQNLADFNGYWGNSYLIMNGVKYLMDDLGTGMALVIEDGSVGVVVGDTHIGTIPLTLVDGKGFVDDGSGMTGELKLREDGTLSMETEGNLAYFEKMP